MRRSALVAWSIVLCAVPAAAQGAGTIAGTVRAAGAGAPNARVTFQGRPAYSTTDSAGRFVLRDVPAGEYVLVATSGDSLTGSAPATVRAGDTTRVTITLLRFTTLAAVTVRAKPRDSYATDSARGASKFPVSLLDVPLDIAVVNRAVIDDRAITEVRDLTKNVSGVIAQPAYGALGLNDADFVFRGIPSDIGPGGGLRDGFREFSLFAARDMVSVDHVEFLKGPESVMYGAVGSIGGLANFVSRAPLAAPAGEFTASADDFGSIRSTLDLGGPLSTSGAVLYRLDASLEHLDSYRAYSDGVGFSIAPAVLWTAGANTTLLLSGQYTERRFRSDPFLPMQYAGALGLPVANFYGEPALPKNAGTGAVAQVTLTQRLGAAWSFREGLSWVRGRTADHGYAFVGPDTLDASMLARLYGKSADASTDVSSQSEFVGDFQTGGIRNRLLAGLELSGATTSHWDTNGDSLASIAYQHPQFGAVPSDTGPVSSNLSTSRQAGLYVQDLADVGSQVKVVLGVRLDLFNAEFGGKGIYWGTAPAEVTKGHYISPRAGIVYQPWKRTSLYASWSRSFAPNLNIPAYGEHTFPPELGDQAELGIKQESTDGRFSATLAVYDILKHNVIIPDPSDPFGRRFMIGGLQYSRGVELDAAGALTRELSLIVAYAFTDSWIAPGSWDPTGSRYPNQPQNRGSVWMRYTSQRGTLRGLAVGGGVTAATGQFADWNNVLPLPSYMIVDAMAGYEYHAVTFQVNLDNLTSARTYQGGGQSLVPGAPRSVRTSVAYRW